MGGFMMLRKRAITESPLLDEGYFMYSEEADLCYRLKAAGWRVVFYPGATVSHHHQASSGRNPRTAAWAYEAKQRGRLRFIRKWRGPVAAYFANLVILIALLPRALGWLAADALAAFRSSRKFEPRSLLKARSLRFHSAVLFQPSRLYGSWAPAALDPSQRS
jgi:GT2 family glycosyltransferase